MPVSSLNLNYIGYDKKTSDFGVPIAAITAVNHDGQVTIADNIQSAADVCTEMAPNSRSMKHSDVTYVATIPADESATRKRGVTLTLRGDTNPKNKVRVTLPGADMSKFPFEAAQSDVVEAPFSGLHIDLTALITALDAGVVHPVSEESMSVYRLEHVGRNL